MKKYILLLILGTCVQNLFAQDYLWTDEEVHDSYFEQYDFIKDGVYYHIVDSDTKEVAVMNHNDICVYVGTWLGRWPDEVMHEWTEGDYSGDIIIPETVEYNGTEYSVVRISCGAFVNCSNVTSIVLPPSIREIRRSAFIATGITSLPVFPENTILHEGLFWHCKSLAVANLTGITNWDDMYYFKGCDILETIILPENAKRIYVSAFEECPSLRKIYMPSPVPPVDGFEFGYEKEFYQNVTLYVPDRTEELYRNAPGWKNFKNILAGEYSGLNSTETHKATEIQSKPGCIIVNTDINDSEIEIYSIAGVKAYSGIAKGNISIPLSPGLYIIRVNDTVQKIAVQ